MADAVAIRINADTRGAQSDIKALGGTFGKLGNSAGVASAGVAAIAAGIAAMGAAAVAATSALIANAREVSRMGDQIAKSARVVGVSAEQYQVLAFAADRSGVSMSSLENGLKRLARNMFDATTGNARMSQTFRDMGIEIRNTDGSLRASDRVLRDIAERVRTLGISSQTSGELMTILGRSGADLTNVLIGGAPALDEYEQRLRDIGGLIDSETLAASEALEDAFTDLDKALLGLKVNIAESIIPGLVDFVNFVTQIMMPAIRDMADVVKRAGASIVDDLRPALEMVGDLLTGRGFGSTRKTLDAFEMVRDAFKPTSPVASAPAAGGRGGGATGGAGGRSPAAEAAVENQTAVMIDLTKITADADAIQTANHMAALAERFMWDNDYETKVRDLRRESVEQIAAWEQQAANDRYTAAAASFGAVETFAGIAQQAVEDSYFGQTKAGRTAAKAMFIAGKAAALAMAIVNTAQAVSAANASAPTPYNIPAIVAASVTGAVSIGTIVATAIQGIADAGLPPGALRAAGLNRHTTLAIRNDEMVVDPKGTSEITQMLSLQRRQMEVGQSANSAPVVVVAELDGQRMTRGLSPHMTRSLEDGHDFRRNVRVSGVA